MPFSSLCARPRAGAGRQTGPALKAGPVYDKTRTSSTRPAVLISYGSENSGALVAVAIGEAVSVAVGVGGAVSVGIGVGETSSVGVAVGSSIVGVAVGSSTAQESVVWQLEHLPRG